MQRIKRLSYNTFSFTGSSLILSSDRLVNISYASQEENNIGGHYITISYHNGRQFYLDYELNESSDFRCDLDKITGIFNAR